MQPLVRYSYEHVVTFGGCQEDFMLVVTSESDHLGDSTKRLNFLDSDRTSSEADSTGTTRLLFQTGKPQVWYCFSTSTFMNRFYYPCLEFEHF